MKLMRFIVVALVALTVTGCTCRTKKVATEDNVPVVEAGGPLKDIYFAFDRYDLSEEAKAILKWNAEWLQANPGTKVQVEGHCDERGTEEYNLALGQKRANAGASYLKTSGVDASRISTVSYGENQPVDPAHNEAAWAKNRRDHFRVEK